MRRPQRGVFQALEGLQEGFRVLDAAEVRADDDGVRNGDAGLFQGLGRGPYRPLQEPAHPPGLHHGEQAAIVGFRVAGLQLAPGMDIHFPHHRENKRDESLPPKPKALQRMCFKGRCPVGAGHDASPPR